MGHWRVKNNVRQKSFRLFSRLNCNNYKSSRREIEAVALLVDTVEKII